MGPEGPRLRGDAGPDDRGFHGAVEVEERGGVLHAHPDHPGAAERREDAGGTQPEVEAGKVRRGGSDLPRERRLAALLRPADEAQREVQPLDGYGTDALEGPQGIRGARDALAHSKR